MVIQATDQILKQYYRTETRNYGQELSMVSSSGTKLLWIYTLVKVEVINNKTTWVRVKITGGKTYLKSKKYKVSLKNTWSKK